MKRKALLLFTLLALFSTGAWAQTTYHISATGSGNTMTWSTFVSNVNNGTSYANCTVYLDEDISIFTTCGIEASPFSGTFDGQTHKLTVTLSNTTDQGTAPFRWIEGATIKNLEVSGNVTSTYHGSGLVGFTKSGDNTIENCLVHTNVSSGDKHIGGIVGHGKGSNINIIGCVYDGTLSSSNYIGGLLGWADGNNIITITNSYFKGDIGDSNKFHPAGFKNGNVECTVNMINVYSINAANYSDSEKKNNSLEPRNGNYNSNTIFNGVPAKRCYSIDGSSNVTVALTGTNSYTYSVSGITGYSTYDDSSSTSSTNSGIIYGGKVYAGSDDVVSLNLGYSGSGTVTGYTANGSDLSGSGNPYSYTMPSSNVTISATVTEATALHDSDGNYMTWSQFAQNVRNGSGSTYSGKTVYLDADVTVTEPIGIQDGASGVSGNHFFAGTFDGQGHTVTLDMTASKDMYGLFAVLNGAKVQNLIIDGSISNSSLKQIGGLSGYTLDACTITNCVSNVSITSTNSSDDPCGGFIGEMGGSSEVTFNGCVFTGTLHTQDKCGGFVGFFNAGGTNWDNNAKLTINNSLFDSHNNSSITNYCGNFTYSNKTTNRFTVTNSYYTTSFGTPQGKQAYTVTYDTERNVTVAMSGSETNYSTSGIKAYKDGDTQLSGLVYNGTIIAGSDDQVSLTLTGGGGANLNRFYATPTGTDLNTSTGKLTMPADNVWIANARRFAFGGPWNDEFNWSPNGLPEPDEDVIIESYVYINCVAKVHNIEISGNGSITIIEGGQLHHCNEGVVATMQKSITGYGESTGKDHFYMMALPFTSFAIAGSPLVTSGAYDLYKFDGSKFQAEWVNYEQSNNTHPFTTIQNGNGFLYANMDGGPMSLQGELEPIPNSGGKTIGLADIANTPFGAWNLVGNPFACNAMSSITDYYVIGGQNDDEVVSSSGVIQPMQGIFVKASATTSSVTFTPTTENSNNNNNSSVNLMLKPADTRDAKVIDVARVRFNEGEGLEKFQLNPSHTKIYIPQNGMDYAVVHAQAEGELPLNFKAENNGRYTLSVDIEKVSFDYLHLIDNMNGNDVDLLATPSYTFDARTTDYASRFKLVFAATGIEENGPSTGSGTFAYNNGSEWVIANEGNATLQVVDMMGRILNSETISGSCSKAINVATGVYMLRLINGNDVKVQKIVVR